MGSAFENPIRLGIVGCGAVARIAHLKALAALPQFEVRFLCDRDPNAARAAKAMFALRAEPTSRIEDFAGRVDAAIVCVWPNLHKTITTDLLAMDLDVLCEKPLAASAANAAAMAEAAHQTNRILAVGHWCRYLKNIWALRRLLDLGFLGEIKEVAAEFGDQLTWPMASGVYYNRSMTSGGVMFDAGIHILDLVSWLFGEITDIRYEDDSYGGTETNGVLFGSVHVVGQKVPCRVSASWTHKLANSVRVRGSQAEAEARLRDRDLLTVTRVIRGERVQLLIPMDDVRLPFRSPVPQIGLLEDFANCVKTRCAPVADAASAVAPLRVLETAYAVRRRMRQPWVEIGFTVPCITIAS